MMIFSTTHSRFNQKIILNIVFMTQSHIVLSEIHLKFVVEFLVLIFLIGQWLVVGALSRWSVVVGPLVGGW